MTSPHPPSPAGVYLSENFLGKIEALFERKLAAIKLDKLRIAGIRVRQTVAVGMMIQVSGDGKNAKADALASRMRKVIGSANLDVRVRRPAKSKAIRVAGFDDSVTRKELEADLASAGGCRGCDEPSPPCSPPPRRRNFKA